MLEERWLNVGGEVAQWMEEKWLNGSAPDCKSVVQSIHTKNPKNIQEKKSATSNSLKKLSITEESAAFHLSHKSSRLDIS
jgi:hypothetical protein